MATIQSHPLVSNCDTVQMFSLPLQGQGAIVRVNDKDLIPSPFLNVSLEKYVVGNIIVGGVMKVQLEGMIVGNSFDDVSSSVNELLNLSKNSDCVNLLIQCSGQFIDGYGRITAFSANQGNQPSWVNLAPYSMEIELYENLGKQVITPSSGNIAPSGISLRGYSEELSLSISEETFNWDEVPGVTGVISTIASASGYKNQGNQHVKASFSISAQGLAALPSCTGLKNKNYGLNGVEQTIINRVSGLKNLDLQALLPNSYPSGLKKHLDGYANGEAYMEFRSVSINTAEQSINVNGEIIYRPSGCPNPDLFTTMTVEETVDDAGRVFTISGNVKGLVRPTYYEIIGLSQDGPRNCDSINRMQSVNNYINYLTKDDGRILLKAIADHADHSTHDYITDTCVSSGNYVDPLTSACPDVFPSASPSVAIQTSLCSGLRLTNSQISRNYGEGTANYSFTLSNKKNCSIVGAKSVNVDVTHEAPADTIVEVVIPGRGAKGPLIQNLCCKTAEKYSINIDATLNSNACGWQNSATSSGLRVCTNQLLSDLEKNSGLDVSCWFVVENQETIGNTSYRLTRRYVKPSCP
jgi:hypothetical protein